MLLFLYLSACYTREKMINYYEWFHTAYQEVQVRKQQVAATTQMINEEKDEKEIRRLKVERAGQTQSCRDLVAAYNAKSDMVTRSSFQGWSLPDHLDSTDCEQQ